MQISDSSRETPSTTGSPAPTVRALIYVRNNNIAMLAKPVAANIGFYQVILGEIQFVVCWPHLISTGAFRAESVEERGASFV